MQGEARHPKNEQAAWTVLATDSELATGQVAKVSVLSRRSSGLRRVVSFALAGETLSLTQGVAELERMQTLYRHV